MQRLCVFWLFCLLLASCQQDSEVQPKLRLVDQGLVLASEQQCRQAIPVLQQALGEADKQVDVRLALAACLEQAGEWLRAYSYIQAMADMQPQHIQLVDAALRLELRGRGWKRAENRINKIHDERRRQYWMLRLWCAQEQWQKAADGISKLAMRADQTAQEAFLLAQYGLHEGAHIEPSLWRLLRSDVAVYRQWILFYARWLQVQQHYDQAINQLLPVVQLYPDDAQLRLLLAHLYALKGEMAKAMSLHQNILRFYPSLETSVLFLGERFLAAHDEASLKKLLHDFRAENASGEAVQAYLQAMLHLSRGQITAADVAGLKKASVVLSKDAGVWSALAQAQWQLADTAAADQAWETALSLNPKMFSALLGQFELALMRRQWSQAERWMQRLQKLDAEHLDVQLLPARLALARREPAKAYDALKLLSTHIDDPLLWDLQLQALQALGKDDALASLLTVLLQAKPKRFSYYLFAAKLAMKQQHFDQAAAYMQGFLENKSQALLLMAKIHLAQQHVKEAEALLLRAQTLAGPHILKVQSQLAALWLQTGKLSKAEALYQQIAKQYPQNLGALYGLATLAQSRGRWTDAEQRYRAMLGLDAELWRARLGLAEVLLAQSKPVEAERLCRSLMSKHQQETRLLLALATSLRLQGKDAEVLGLYQQAVALGGDLHDTALLQRGLWQLRHMAFAKAEADFAEILKRQPHHGQALMAWVDAVALQGRVDDAMAALDQRLKRASDDVFVLRLRASLALRTGRLKQAERDAALALKFDAYNQGTRLLLARIYQLSGQLEKALAVTQAVSEGQKPVGVWMLEADLLRTAGRDQEAEQVLRKVLAVQPDFVEALNNLADLLLQQERQLDEALALARRAYVQRQDAITSATYGHALWRLKHMVLARSVLAKAYRENPESTAIAFDYLAVLWAKPVSEEQQRRGRSVYLGLKKRTDLTAMQKQKLQSLSQDPN